MILSTWKPKYKVIDEKNTIYYYTEDEIDLTKKGNSNHKVLYKYRW